MKKLFPALAVAFVVLVAVPAFAQSGCVNSPENPTAVLALVGSAGAGLTMLRGRFRRR